MPGLESLRTSLDRVAADEQRAKRLPSLVAAVARDGEIIWDIAIGMADLETGEPTKQTTQYRLGSITKTFTAAAVMQLRDDGKLDIEAPYTEYVREAAHAPTIRQLLSHMSGLQRETQDFPWVHGRFASTEELMRTLDRAERVLPPGSRFHYSNLGFSLLGVLVERVSSQPYAQYIESELIQPVGLERTAFTPDDDVARGYLPQHHADCVWSGETHTEAGARAAAGALWGTVPDLCHWGSFLARPDGSVLAEDSAVEMRALQAVSDDVSWSAGYGLGLGLYREGGRILFGHGGGLPGYVAGLVVAPKDKIVAAALTNSGLTSLNPFLFTAIAETIDNFPALREPWTIGDEPPPEVQSLLGPHFVQASELVFRWREGHLEARYTSAPEWQPPAVFRAEGPGRWRIVSGGEQGELLTIDGDTIVLGGYPVTPEPAFWG